MFYKWKGPDNPGLLFQKCFKMIINKKGSRYNCLIFKSPLSESNQRPTDYKSVFILLLLLTIFNSCIKNAVFSGVGWCFRYQVFLSISANVSSKFQYKNK